MSLHLREMPAEKSADDAAGGVGDRTNAALTLAGGGGFLALINEGASMLEAASEAALLVAMLRAVLVMPRVLGRLGNAVRRMLAASPSRPL